MKCQNDAFLPIFTYIILYKLSIIITLQSHCYPMRHQNPAFVFPNVWFTTEPFSSFISILPVWFGEYQAFGILPFSHSDIIDGLVQDCSLA